MRSTHVDAHLPCLEFSADHARERFKADLRERVSMQVIHEAPKAAGAVATHLRLAAIGVVVAHFEVTTLGGRLHAEKAIRADAAMAVTQLLDLLFGEGQLKVAIVQHDEVIASAVHFGELEGHGKGRRVKARAVERSRRSNIKEG